MDRLASKPRMFLLRRQLQSALYGLLMDKILTGRCYHSSCLGVHTVKIIRYGTGTVYFIRFQYSNGIDTGYFLYFVDVFEILSRA